LIEVGGKNVHLLFRTGPDLLLGYSCFCLQWFYSLSASMLA